MHKLLIVWLYGVNNELTCLIINGWVSRKFTMAYSSLCRSEKLIPGAVLVTEPEPPLLPAPPHLCQHGSWWRSHCCTLTQRRTWTSPQVFCIVVNIALTWSTAVVLRACIMLSKVNRGFIQTFIPQTWWLSRSLPAALQCPTIRSWSLQTGKLIIPQEISNIFPTMFKLTRIKFFYKVIISFFSPCFITRQDILLNY